MARAGCILPYMSHSWMKITLMFLVVVLGTAAPYLCEPVSACPGMSGGASSDSASSCCGSSCDCGMKNQGGQVELAMLPSTVSPEPSSTGMPQASLAVPVLSGVGQTEVPEVPLDVSKDEKIYDRLSQQRI